MGMFDAINSSVSGATTARVWLDAISDNVANVNTVRPAGEEPFRARYVVARAVGGGAAGQAGKGVAVESVVLKPGQAPEVYDPDHPLADEDGMVTRAHVDMGEEMTNLVLASRAYQANLSVLDRVRDAYKRALDIGAR